MTGLFSLNLKREFYRCCCCLKRTPSTSYYEMVTQSAMMQAASRSPSNPASKRNSTVLNPNSVMENGQGILDLNRLSRNSHSALLVTRNPTNNGFVANTGQDEVRAHAQRKHSTEYICHVTAAVDSNVNGKEPIAMV